MGFLDNLRDRFTEAARPYDDEYDDYYDDEYYDDGYEDYQQEDDRGVRVMRRGGKSTERDTYATGTGEVSSRTPAGYTPPPPHRGAYSTPSMFATESMQSTSSIDDSSVSSTNRFSVVGSSVQKSVYLMKPHIYDEVEEIVSSMRDGHPVAISLTDAKPEVARRVLDFAFGYACGVEGKVERAANKVFVILPKGGSLTSEDKDKMRMASFIPGE